MTIVLWSGGCDSTLTLFLEAKKASADKPVRALSINHDRVGAQAEQKRARTLLRAEFKKRGLPIDYAEINVTQGANDEFYANHDAGLVQPMFWIPHALPFLEEKEDLVVGYIRTDCAFHYRNVLGHIFNNSQVILHKEGKLVFPLEWMDKWDVVKRLRDEKLFDLVWYCEDPAKGKTCGRCVPCTNVFIADAVLKKEHGGEVTEVGSVAKKSKRAKKKGKR